jgi:D-alanyl-D-alanine dipeptidase
MRLAVVMSVVPILSRATSQGCRGKVAKRDAYAEYESTAAAAVAIVTVTAADAEDMRITESYRPSQSNNRFAENQPNVR